MNLITKAQLIKPISKDARGQIVNVLGETKVASVLVIHSKKGSVRANHYHKKDSHYMYVINGKMRYTIKDMKKTSARKRSFVVKAGEMVYTPPMMAHAVEFLEDGVFLALTGRSRKQKAYEGDTVRLKLV